MSEIMRVTDPNQGPLDGVSLDAKGVFTRFAKDDDGKRSIEDQKVHDVIIRASYEAGVASVTIRDLDVMVSVRIDELLGLLLAASTAAKEIQEGGQAQ